MASEFWDVIELARLTKTSCAERAHELEQILGKLSSPEIEAFARAQQDLMRASYRWDLWGAAFVINGGCSDDGFDYFRGWLMLQGRDVWEAALRDPESLAGVSFDGDAQCEDVLYAAGKAYEQVAGRVLSPARDDYPKQPMGTAWQETDLESLHPKLWKHVAAQNVQGQAEAGGSEDFWDRQMATGMALLASGSFERAAQVFATVRKDASRKRTGTIATNNLAWTELMIGTPVAVKEALSLANEAMQAFALEPNNEAYLGFIKGTLAFALIKNDEVSAGLALIDEVLATESPGPQILALRLCVRAIGMARTGDHAGARSVIQQARHADPTCQLLGQAVQEVPGEAIVVPQELHGLAPLVQRFGLSDDGERERVLEGASTEELIALVSAVTKDTFDQINQFLDQTGDSEEAVPFGDLAQAAMEAKLELTRRGIQG